MPTHTKRLFNKKLLTDKFAFKYYRENAKHRDLKNTYRQEAHASIIRDFYRKIGENMVESSQGVFIKNFGYFGILMNPIKTSVNINRNWIGEKLLLNSHTRGRVFHPIFLPICDNFKFKLFIMDKSFNRKLKMKLKEKLQNNMKYFNNYGFLNSMYKNKR